MTSLEQLEVDAFLAHAEDLARLIEQPAWAAYTALLRDMRQAALEELARCPDASEVRFWQGAANALQEIIERPGRIVASAADYRRAEEAESQTARLGLRSLLSVASPEDSI